MTGCVEQLAVISFDSSDCATRLAIHAPALSNPLSRMFQQSVRWMAPHSTKAAGGDKCQPCLASF